MGDTTISWCHRPGTRARTWNPTQGCALKSEGCRNCYAMRQARRFAGPGKPFEGLVNLQTGKWTGKARLATHKLAEPLSWRDPSTVFVDSMSDLFYEGFTNEEIAAVFGVMAACPQHVFQILTKRADRMREWFAWVAAHEYPLNRVHQAAFDGLRRSDSRAQLEAKPAMWPLRNVWLGVSVEHQDAADERIPDLLRTPAVIRFLSCEPLLGPIDLGVHFFGHCPEHDFASGFCVDRSQPEVQHLRWVIAGSESGPGWRAADVAWFRFLRDQCLAARVPFFLKQARPAPGIHHGPASNTSHGVIEPPYLDHELHTAFPEAV